MRRRFAASLALILLAACATSHAPRSALRESPQGAPGAAQIFLWKVTPSDGSAGTLYLQGAVHVERGAHPRLDRAALAALEGADEAVVEVELTPEVIAEVAQVTQARGMLPEGELLSGRLSAETWGLVVARCEALGLSAGMFERMSPWMVAATLPILELKLSGYGEEAGVDRFVARRARELGKPVRSLETAAFQVDLFAGLTPELQERMLRDGLREGDFSQQIEALFGAYRAGDVAAMEAATFQDLKAHPEYAELYERIYFSRNSTMAEKLGAMLREQKRFFVAVGAAHLIGDQGLVAHFERSGHRVERVAPLGVAEVGRAEQPWVPVVDEAVGFRFELPAPPQVQSMPTGPGVEAATSYVLDQTILAFAVAAAPLPELPEGFDPRMLVDMAANGAAAQSGGTVESLEDATFAGAPARHLRYTIPGGRAESYLAIRDGALFVAGVVYVGKSRVEDPREAQARRFFESFSFDAGAAPAAAP
jgi:uncharacterized protein YbaP (TraB family)